MRKLLLCIFSAASIAAIAAGTAVAQGSTIIRGTVRADGDQPVEGANVFILETLEGSRTAADGTFSIATTQHGTATLVVRRVGFQQLQRQLEIPVQGALALSIVPQAAVLTPMTVSAGAYTAGDEHGATLTTLEVATTPGTTADVARAIQTLPGVQMVDEGNGLFVRGGDVSETKVLVNDAPLPSPVRLETPTGNFMGTVNAFLLDGIFFSSGGFGARYGNILSGLAALRTQGRPKQDQGTFSVGLGAISAGGGVALPNRVGLRATATLFSTAPIMKVNGATQSYDPPPSGHDVSASATWNYGGAGEVKLFAITQTTKFGVGVDGAAYSGGYGYDLNTSTAVLGWHDQRGIWNPSITTSMSGFSRNETYGAFILGTHFSTSQALFRNEFDLNDRVTIRAGTEVERIGAGYTGSIPRASYDNAPGARVNVFSTNAPGTRSGSYIEAQFRQSEPLQLVLGGRTDHSSLTRQTTYDPRASASLKAGHDVTFTGAWGIYHQIPDGLLFSQTSGRLNAMRNVQTVLGVEAGENERIARVEIFTKAYADLAQLDRDDKVVGGGTGRARGADFLFKSPLPLGATGRLTYSYVDSRRTEPNVLQQARAPYDITNSATLVLEKIWPMWRIGFAERLATGRPFTDVASASFDNTRQIFVPTYASPMADRLPPFARTDLSASYVRPVSPKVLGVYYISLENIFDRSNTYTYRYPADYSRRIPVRSLFNRSVYFGASFSTL